MLILGATRCWNVVDHVKLTMVNGARVMDVVFGTVENKLVDAGFKWQFFLGAGGEQ